jgi:hypothetical protein
MLDVQFGGRHSVVESGYAHAFRSVPPQLPTHFVPAPPHAGLPLRGVPVIGMHVPTETLHASHCPWHAVSQHTPSTQWPDWHCTSPRGHTSVSGSNARQIPESQK